MTTPTVQHCPKRFSDAIRNPFDKTVTRVLESSGLGVAYTASGKFLSVSVRGGKLVTTFVDGTFTVLPPLLALPVFSEFSFLLTEEWDVDEVFVEKNVVLDKFLAKDLLFKIFATRNDILFDEIKNAAPLFFN